MSFDDESAARELDLYAENTSELYPQRRAIAQNLKRKIERGTYQPALAPKLWDYWYQNAARRYVKEFGGDVRTMFPTSMRKELARDRAKDEYKRIRAGEYGPVKKHRRHTKRKHSSKRPRHFGQAPGYERG